VDAHSGDYSRLSRFDYRDGENGSSEILAGTRASLMAPARETSMPATVLRHPVHTRAHMHEEERERERERERETERERVHSHTRA